MKEIRISSWQELQTRITEIQLNHPQGSRGSPLRSDILFRGQTNAAWTLESTLERMDDPPLGLLDYFSLIEAIKLEIGSRVGREWVLPSFWAYAKLLKERAGLYPIPDELYEYLVYLRHYGFPSPLLDWTASPYIAAHFAFRNARSNTDVAIFAYLEDVGSGKSTIVGAPQIYSLGPNVRTDARHYLQQSQYTVAFRGMETEASYCSHELIFGEAYSGQQDLLWKFVLPGSLRREVLQYLHLHNLTDYSLFTTEESLMNTLSARLFVINRRRGTTSGDVDSETHAEQ